MVDYSNDEEEEDGSPVYEEVNPKMEAHLPTMEPRIPIEIIIIEDSSSEEPLRLVSRGKSKAKTKNKNH